MSAPNLDQPANMEPAKLPRRDWILLPLFSISTIAVLVAQNPEAFERSI
jgi:hypothetical protein